MSNNQFVTLVTDAVTDVVTEQTIAAQGCDTCDSKKQKLSHARARAHTMHIIYLSQVSQVSQA